MQRLTARFVQVVRCRANITTGAASCHALQDETLIRPDDPCRRVMRQDLILQREKEVLDKFDLYYDKRTERTHNL